ncbi:MAG: nucleoside kinase [Huintestinicola sp.]
MTANYINIASLNKNIDTAKEKLVALSEDNYSCYIKDAALKIERNAAEKPLVLLSGPSGSGKTTAALRIARELEGMGHKVHTISMDNYFLPGSTEHLPRDEEGNVDLESPHRLDIDLFSEHLKALSECRTINMPVFDFATQSRSGYIPVTRSKGEIIIIEGIHALNPLVTGESKDFTTCIYVSVRTRIKSKDGSMLHPRLIRLMRRLCRDRLFRGRDIPDIFHMFSSVSRGEDLYIMPFKNRADIEIDTFMPYEASVYRGLIYSDLAEKAAEMEGDPNYSEIMRFFSELHPLDEEYIPSASLIREFVGGSELNY